MTAGTKKRSLTSNNSQRAVWERSTINDPRSTILDPQCTILGGGEWDNIQWSMVNCKGKGSTVRRVDG